MRPGEQRELKLSVEPGSRYVGVLAAYRDLPESNWRLVIPVQQKALNRTALELDEKGIRDQATVSRKRED
ncbi:Type VI secretion lipoprotein [compost metagenome]